LDVAQQKFVVFLKERANKVHAGQSSFVSLEDVWKSARAFHGSTIHIRLYIIQGLLLLLDAQTKAVVEGSL
jgi:hypothetical protein